MKVIYIFADETGDLGYTPSSSEHFGFGTVTLDETSSQTLWNSFKLRCELESEGFPLKQGFHAQQDRYVIRARVFELISQSNPSFDFTFLKKANAYEYVKSRGDLGLYKMAWYLHFKFLAEKYQNQDMRFVIVIADMQTKSKKYELRAALQDVSLQFPKTKSTLVVWNSNTSWGLQMADYGTWSAQRILRGQQCEFWEKYVSKLNPSFYKPWG